MVGAFSRVSYTGNSNRLEIPMLNWFLGADAACVVVGLVFDFALNVLPFL